LGPVRRNLNEKLASVLLDCHAKDDPVTENEKSEQRATAGDSSIHQLLLVSVFVLLLIILFLYMLG
jgi:hypothetical protein